MLKLSRAATFRAALAGLLMAVTLATGVIGVLADDAGVDSVPILTDQELLQFRLFEVRDVTADASMSESLPVSRETAIAVAYAELGETDASVRVLRARASQYMTDPVRDVWVITVPGGTASFDGPPRTPTKIEYRLTGIVIDAHTGAFLRGFMI